VKSIGPKHIVFAPSVLKSSTNRGDVAESAIKNHAVAGTPEVLENHRSEDVASNVGVGGNGGVASVAVERPGGMPVIASLQEGRA